MDHAVIVMIALILAAIVNLVDVVVLLRQRKTVALLRQRKTSLTILRVLISLACGSVAWTYYNTLSGILDQETSTAVSDLMFSVLAVLLVANVVARWSWRRPK